MSSIGRLGLRYIPWSNQDVQHIPRVPCSNKAVAKGPETSRGSIARDAHPKNCDPRVGVPPKTPFSDRETISRYAVLEIKQGRGGGS